MSFAFTAVGTAAEVLAVDVAGPLRWRWLPTDEPRDIAINHHNLATYLGTVGVDRAGQPAHRLAGEPGPGSPLRPHPTSSPSW